jgi:hypothetical protein
MLNTAQTQTSNILETRKKDPVVETMPSGWVGEQQVIAKEAMAMLKKHYPGWQWALEWTETVGGELGALIIRLSDVPTDVVYMVNYKDMDRDNMYCIMRAGGEFLEALNLSRSKGRWDEVRGLKTTAAGLIVPDYAAMPENNPGYAKIKKQFTNLQE